MASRGGFSAVPVASASSLLISLHIFLIIISRQPPPIVEKNGKFGDMVGKCVKAFQSRYLAMANANLNMEGSKLIPNPGAPFKVIEFIDEQARQRDPKSHERTLVRSTAKKNDNLKRRALNAAHTSSTSTRLKYLEKKPESNTITKSSLAHESAPKSQIGQLARGANVSIRRTVSLQRSSPQTILGAGRVDPFGVFPMKMSPYLHKLFDY
jgi:hypothetical protein